jgi:hypothetical protein
VQLHEQLAEDMEFMEFTQVACAAVKMALLHKNEL